MAYKKTVSDIERQFGPQSIAGIQRLLDRARVESGLPANQFFAVVNALEPVFFDVIDRAGLPEDRFWQAYSDHAAETIRPEEIAAQQPQREVPPIAAPKPEPTPLSPDKTQRLKEFQDTSSETHRRWLNGDTALNDERQALYNEQYQGETKID